MFQEDQQKIEDAASPLDTFVIPRGRRQIIREIIAEEAKKFNLSPYDIIGDARNQKVVHARHVAMWRARKETGAPFLYIAGMFNRKDHSTVMHAVQKIEAIMNLKEEYFCYVPHSLQKLFEDYGWEFHSDLGPPHCVYSSLFKWVGDGDPVYPDTKIEVIKKTEKEGEE